MTDTLSIGWTRSDADRKISAFKRAFGFITAVQLIVAFIYLLWPTLALNTVGLDPATGNEWSSVWAATLILVTLYQFPGLLDPVRNRFTVVMAVFARVWMSVTFLILGGSYYYFAAFDIIFGTIIAITYYRLVIAELMTRP